MGLSILGAICIGGGCTALGFMAFMQLENRVRLLTAFAGLCDRLVGEIGFRMTPLPDLAEKMETPVLCRFWGDIKKTYRPYGAETYAESWRKAAGKLELSEMDRALIAEIGGVLGQYDVENQTRALVVIREQLKISLDVARERRQKQGKMAGMLGVLCGALLIVILI